MSNRPELDCLTELASPGFDVVDGHKNVVVAVKEYWDEAHALADILDAKHTPGRFYVRVQS